MSSNKYWYADLYAESKMAELNLSFKVEEIPIAAINTNKSINNNARAESIDPVVVEDYAIALERGDKFPRLIAFEEKGEFILI